MESSFIDNLLTRKADFGKLTPPTLPLPAISSKRLLWHLRFQMRPDSLSSFGHFGRSSVVSHFNPFLHFGSSFFPASRRKHHVSFISSWFHSD
jgi:hypothetical protein